MASSKSPHHEPSLLRRPNAIPNQDRLTSSCHAEESAENQQNTRPLRSIQSKLSKTSLKRSNSSIAEQMGDSQAKPHPPSKRTAVQPADVKSDMPTRMTTRSATLKNRNVRSTNSSTRQDQKISTTKSIVSSLPKSSTTKNTRSATSSAVVPGNKTTSTLEMPPSKITGAAAAASKIGSIPPTPTAQTPKSLKDHLAEIRANAAPRKSSETTVPAASHLRKNTKHVTTVTSTSVPLCRTNSLIPESNRSSAAVMAAATSQALAKKEDEILALKQQLDTTSSQWNKVFDTLCIFSRWSLNKKDQLLEKASRREKELTERVKALSEECAQAKTNLEKLLHHHSKNQSDQTKAWEKERLALQGEMETLRVRLHSEKEKEIEKIRLQCDADISALQKAYDMQLTEERRVWASRVAESHNKFSTQLDQQQIDYETQISELKRHNATRLSEVEGRFKSTESELMAKMECLRSECDELRKASENRKGVSPELQIQIPSSAKPSTCDVSVQTPSSSEVEKELLLTMKGQEVQEQPQQQLQNTSSFNFDDIPISMTRSCYMPPTKPVRASFFVSTPPRQKALNITIPCTDGSTMQEEIESLKTVLELKSAENADLRQKAMRLEEQLNNAKDLSKEIKELQNRNENLEALLELRAESQRQLQDRYQGMFQNLDKMVKEKKKLKMDCESLRFKLLDAHHKIEQLNTANASEDDTTSMTDSLCMSRSVHCDARVVSSDSMAKSAGSVSRPISETLGTSETEADDRPSADLSIAQNTRSTSSSVQMRRGLKHDRSKRRTLATSGEFHHRF